MNRRMKNVKKIKCSFCLGLALTMAVSTIAIANPTIAPDGSVNQTQETQVQTQTMGGPSGETSAAQQSASYLTAFPAVTATVTTGLTSTNASAGTSTGNTAANIDGGVTGTAVKPVVQSQGAVLYDATHNQFLFEQNADTRFYPASITKIMTALLVLENTSLTDTVTFSSAAVTNLESGAVTLNVKAGDTFTVKDCMYGLMLKSANEVANGLAEKVSGSVGAFANLMNQKAVSLGCTNTNFVNPNGLNNANHYTTARDMALIAKAAFANPTLSQIASTINYNFPASASMPSVRKLTMGHKMLNSGNTAYYYPGVVGGKTGYTSLAGNTLVTCAERDGVRLIAVILKSKQTHYQDTKALLDYGFEMQKSGSITTGTAGAAGPGGGTAANPSVNGPGMGNSGTGAPGAAQTPAANGNTWSQDANGWRFVKADGSFAKKEFMVINSEYYYFKEDTYMAVGWYQPDGIWRYFRPSGGLAVNRWVETNAMWYYVDMNGCLYTNGTTPDGFPVDANGVWVK